MDSPQTRLSRRSLLQAAALSAVAVSSAPLLSGCGGSDSSSSAATTTVDLPDYIPAGKVKPDLPGTNQGVQEGYLKPVTDYFATVTEPPGAGGAISAFVLSYLPPPPPVEKNTWWQAVNKALNADLRVEITPAADYPAKFGTVMSGTDIPDLVQIPLFLNLPRLPDLLKSRFADLSDHLSGSNVKTYPNLAGLPTYAWENARINGRIYGVPLTRPVFAGTLFSRQDILDRMGIDPPDSAESFEAICKEVTDARAGRWALGGEKTFDLPYLAQVFGAPFRWRKGADGTLVRDYETDEYRAALEFAVKLNKAGYYHPDTVSTNISQVKDLFAAGKVVMYQDGLSAWKAQYDVYGKSQPDNQVSAVLPFAAQGGKAIQYLDVGVYSITGIKQGDDARVTELLRVLNYLAAPFGSKEALLAGNGVEGVDYKTNADGIPVGTDRGQLEQAVGFFYIMAGTPVLSSGDYPQWVKAQHAWEQKAAPLGVGDPTKGAYSETNSKVGGQINQAITDALTNIMSGRAPLSQFDQALQTWKSGGGDKIRDELQAALAGPR